jgi:hypothetical protein
VNNSRILPRGSPVVNANDWRSSSGPPAAWSRMGCRAG